MLPFLAEVQMLLFLSEVQMLLFSLTTLFRRGTRRPSAVCRGTSPMRNSALIVQGPRGMRFLMSEVPLYWRPLVPTLF